MHVVDERVGGLVGKSPMIFTDKLSAEMSKRQFKKEQKKQKKKKKKKNNPLQYLHHLSYEKECHVIIFFSYSVTIITSLHTVKILKFGTPQTIAIIVPKIVKFDVTLH